MGLMGAINSTRVKAVECHQFAPAADKLTMMPDQNHAQSSSSTLRVAIDPKSVISAYL
jgi:hypothetical protein